MIAAALVLLLAQLQYVYPKGKSHLSLPHPVQHVLPRVSKYFSGLAPKKEETKKTAEVCLCESVPEIRVCPLLLRYHHVFTVPLVSSTQRW